MKKFTHSVFVALIALLMSQDLNAQEIFSANFDEDECGFTVMSQPQADNEAWSRIGGAGRYMQADGFNKCNERTDFYLISPELTLEEHNTVQFRQFFDSFKDIQNEAQLVIREVGGEWTKIKSIDYEGEDYPAQTWLPTGYLEIPSEFNGKTVQVAFKYTADGSSTSGLWRVTDFRIKCSDYSLPVVRDVIKVTAEPYELVEENKFKYNCIKIDVDATKLQNPNFEKAMKFFDSKKHLEKLLASYHGITMDELIQDPERFDLLSTFISEHLLEEEATALANNKSFTSIYDQLEPETEYCYFILIPDGDQCLIGEAYVKTEAESAQGTGEVLFEESFQEGLGEFEEEINSGFVNKVWQYTTGTEYGSGITCMPDCDGVSHIVSPEIQLGTDNKVAFDCVAAGFTVESRQYTFSVREVGGEWTEIEFPANTDLTGNKVRLEISIPEEFNNKKVNIGFNCNNAYGVVIISNLVVTGVNGGATPSEKVDPAIAYDQTEVAYTMGDVFEAPVLSNPNNVAVTYSSSDENVAIVAEDGTVSVLGEGITTIKAVSAETEEFKAGEASYVLTVSKAQGGEGEGVEAVLFEHDFANGVGEFKEEPANYVWQDMSFQGFLYADAGGVEVDARMVSPEFQLGTNNTITFSYLAVEFDDLENNLMVSIREVGGEWTEMKIPAEYLNNEGEGFTEVKLNVPAEFDNKNVQIAFRYVAANGTAGIKDVVVKGTKGGTPTGIEGISAENLNDGNIYDLQGRKVNKLGKGVFIINGKKVIIK